MSSITGAKFSMDAEILHQGDYVPTDNPTDPNGHWVGSQDPITGQIVNKWLPVTAPTDNPNTEVDEFAGQETIPCIVRAIVGTGVSRSGVGETFGDIYIDFEYLQMWVPGWVDINKNDRVTNIRDRRSGTVVWKDEESVGNPPTVYNVDGVTPLLDYRNKVTEKLIRLERAPGDGS